MSDRSRAANAAHMIRPDHLPQDGQNVRVSLGERERASLASRLGILAVERFEAEIVATPWRRHGAAVRGWLKALVVQESVVTLEPVRQTIEERVDLTFLPEGSQAAPSRSSDAVEIELDPEGEDLPDVFEGDSVNLDAALEEVLALAIDPYPREAAERFEAGDDEEAVEDEKVSPFAALAALKPKRMDG